LSELDPLPPERTWATFVPEERTRAGRPLGERAAMLLLGSTFEDLEVMSNEINLRAQVDDDDEAAELTTALAAYEEILGRHRLLPRDSDDRTLARMPVDERRRVRSLENRIRQLRAARYDGSVLRQRSLRAAVTRQERLLSEAESRGDTRAADERRHTIDRLRAELAAREKTG
jgi:hypothetical protein